MAGESYPTPQGSDNPPDRGGWHPGRDWTGWDSEQSGQDPATPEAGLPPSAVDPTPASQPVQPLSRRARRAAEGYVRGDSAHAPSVVAAETAPAPARPAQAATPPALGSRRAALLAERQQNRAADQAAQRAAAESLPDDAKLVLVRRSAAGGGGQTSADLRMYEMGGEGGAGMGRVIRATSKKVDVGVATVTGYHYAESGDATAAFLEDELFAVAAGRSTKVSGGRGSGADASLAIRRAISELPGAIRAGERPDVAIRRLVSEGQRDASEEHGATEPVALTGLQIYEQDGRRMVAAFNSGGGQIYVLQGSTVYLLPRGRDVAFSEVRPGDRYVVASEGWVRGMGIAGVSTDDIKEGIARWSLTDRATPDGFAGWLLRTSADTPDKTVLVIDPQLTAQGQPENAPEPQPGRARRTTPVVSDTAPHGQSAATQAEQVSTGSSLRGLGPDGYGSPQSRRELVPDAFAPETRTLPDGTEEEGMVPVDQNGEPLTIADDVLKIRQRVYEQQPRRHRIRRALGRAVARTMLYLGLAEERHDGDQPDQDVAPQLPPVPAGGVGDLVNRLDASSDAAPEAVAGSSGQQQPASSAEAAITPPPMPVRPEADQAPQVQSLGDNLQTALAELKDLRYRQGQIIVVRNARTGNEWEYHPAATGSGYEVRIVPFTAKPSWMSVSESWIAGQMGTMAGDPDVTFCVRQARG